MAVIQQQRRRGGGGNRKDDRSEEEEKEEEEEEGEDNQATQNVGWDWSPHQATRKRPNTVEKKKKTTKKLKTKRKPQPKPSTSDSEDSDASGEENEEVRTARLNRETHLYENYFEEQMKKKDNEITKFRSVLTSAQERYKKLTEKYNDLLARYKKDMEEKDQMIDVMETTLRKIGHSIPKHVNHEMLTWSDKYVKSHVWRYMKFINSTTALVAVAQGMAEQRPDVPKEEQKTWCATYSPYILVKLSHLRTYVGQQMKVECLSKYQTSLL
jgi:hypothetical protein